MKLLEVMLAVEMRSHCPRLAATRHADLQRGGKWVKRLQPHMRLQLLDYVNRLQFLKANER